MERVELESFLERFPTETRPREAETLARELVRARRLTEYQAGARPAREVAGTGDRQLPDPRQAREGRHGHGVQGPAPPDEARRRAQGPAPLVRPVRIGRASLPARGRGRRPARSPEHRGRPRRRRVQRVALLRHGICRRERPDSPGQGRRARCRSTGRSSISRRRPAG